MSLKTSKKKFIHLISLESARPEKESRWSDKLIYQLPSIRFEKLDV